MPQKWSREIVIHQISKLYRGGQRLSSEYIKENNVPLYGGALKYCGGWRQAVGAAGIDYNDVRAKRPNYQFWSKEIIVQTILSMHEQELPLNSNHVQTKEPGLYRAAYNYFGGWPEAITAAGLDYSKLRKKDPMRSWTKATIVAEVLRRHEQGLSIRGGDVYVQDRGLYQAAKRFFGKGSWAKARILAGFDPVDPRPEKVWDEQTIPEEIKRLHENGVPLNTGALYTSPYRYIHSAGRVVFGSWAKAVKAAGLDYKKIRKGRQKGWWTKPRILMCIRSLDKRGIRLSHDALRNSHGALLGIAVYYFGSWSQAVEAAGISYRLHTRVWSTKAWLRRMQPGEYTATLERAQTHARKRRSSK